MADPAIAGAVARQYFTAATSFVATAPSSSVSGEVIVFEVQLNENTKFASASGYTRIDIDKSTWETVYLWKAATGSDPGTVTINVEPSGTSTAHILAYRLQNVDTTDPFNSANFVEGTTANSSTPSIAANTITVGSGNGVLFTMGCEAIRTVTTADTDLTVIEEYAANASSFHSYIDPAVAGTGNPAYDFTMSDARAYGYSMIELNPAGGTLIPIFMHHYRNNIG
jgi:hypothetical protein